MTSISNYTMAMPPSPRLSMDRKIDAAVEAGALSDVDGDALETALDSIGSALSASAGEGSARLDPSEMKSRIDSLIDGQVSAGTLTQDQAAQLQSFFAQGPGNASGADTADSAMSVDGMGGVGGPGAMRGPPPGPPPSADSSEDDDSAASSADTASATEQLDSIIAFLENLRSNMSQSLYGGTTNGADSSNSGLVIDSLA